MADRRELREAAVQALHEERLMPVEKAAAVTDIVLKAVAGLHEPQPGVMHPIDQAFYADTVSQRDRAWREIESVKTLLRELWEFPDRPAPPDGEPVDMDMWTRQEAWAHRRAKLDERVRWTVGAPFASTNDRAERP